MAITRINHFEAKSGSEQSLYEFLQSVIVVVSKCEGCVGCELLRSLDNPASLAIIEKWDSVESHQKAASAIPPEKLKEVFALFAKPASGTYYSN
ncbi:MAG TPA: antibiotic biosynthesis monooxygenase family protein [Cellvibrio sp.]|nr:antibiotic biosynthesis monooxygenase family protein [Cellvibrio sp.]